MIKKFFSISLLILLVLISCIKQKNCNNVDGVWKLSKVIKDGNVVCSYTNSFYYKYAFSDGIVTCVQVRNGVDSFIYRNLINCDFVYSVSPDSFRYGDQFRYAILVK